MNVLLISECSGKALVESRRILDQFAQRRGERTWQTAITQEGLDTLRGLLRRTARRNTAVACHWIRGRNRTELLWIVGDARRFDEEGAVPTNTTERDVLRGSDENDWHTAEVIRLLAKLAGLFHDLGKASRAFQTKLKDSGRPSRDAYRHEWVSLRLFQAFVEKESDTAWLERLATLTPQPAPSWLDRLERDGLGAGSAEPFARMTPLARAVGWLILSHHFLPEPDSVNLTAPWLERLSGHISASWNSADDKAARSEIAAVWDFPHGTPFESAAWCARVRDAASSIQRHAARLLAGTDWLGDPYVAHLARLCLMLGDHYYSALPPATGTRGDAGFNLYANTSGPGILKQRLDDHLIGVGEAASRIARHLPRLPRELPRIARHKGFTRRTTEPRFDWQNKGYELAVALRDRAAKRGFFGVNMASTGTGKTLANARIMYGLADPRVGARFSIALGLRTLTLQTGQAYRERLSLAADDLGVLVGGLGVKELYEHGRPQGGAGRTGAADLVEASGSASARPLDLADSYVHYEGSIPEGPLQRWLQRNPHGLKLLGAPILVCTIDHLIAATEGTRGGRQIAPMLRLLTADLVLDEPDDFDLDDLPALARLVHWAGLLGSRVLLSSASLAPALVEGLFRAYLAGRTVHERNHQDSSRGPSVCCAWFDEHRAEDAAHAEATTFAETHRQFVQRRVGALRRRPVRQRAEIKAIEKQAGTAAAAAWASQFLECITRLHEAHRDTDPASGRTVSVGLVRMANIGPLVRVARELLRLPAPEGHRLHLCCYHSQHPLLVRSAIEMRLDALLDRTTRPTLFEAEAVREVLTHFQEPHQVFVVLATPVAEVGRDHDYDWAIVEPSSMRSIVQVAGRVRRHRPEKCDDTNILLLERNFRDFEGQPGPVFCRPGFEKSPDWFLRSHRLSEVLTPEQYREISAEPRIVERASLRWEENLADLEHARLRALMAGGPGQIDLWWETPAHLTGVLQAEQRFRASRPTDTFVLLPDEDEREWTLHRKERNGTTDQNHELERVTDAELLVSESIRPWPKFSYLDELARLAEDFALSSREAALRFGWVDLPRVERPRPWRYHPSLGFTLRPEAD